MKSRKEDGAETRGMASKLERLRTRIRVAAETGDREAVQRFRFVHRITDPALDLRPAGKERPRC